jgi:O-antigen ligase
MVVAAAGNTAARTRRPGAAVTAAAVLRHRAVRSALVRLTPALTVVGSLALTCLLIRQQRMTVLALAAAVITSAALCRPATVALLLIPLGLLGTVLTDVTFIVLAVVVVALTVAFQTVAGAHTVRPPQLWVGLLTCLLAVSFVPSMDGSATSMTRFLDLAGILAGLGLLAAAIAVPPHPRNLAKMTALAGALAAGYALANGDEAAGRLEGLGFNPNYLGALLAPPLAAAVGLTRRTRNPAWLAAGAVCLVAMAWTQSRGAFIAATVGVGVALVHGRPRRQQALITLVTAGVVFVLPGVLDSAWHAAVGGRATAELSHNREVREQTAEFALRVAAEHPLHGIGYGLFSSYAARSPGFGLEISTHNEYLRLAAESGAAALGVFLVLLWLAVRGRPSGDLSLALAIMLTSATSLLFANLLANLTISMPFWLSLGCLLAAGRSRAGPTVPSPRAHPKP